MWVPGFEPGSPGLAKVLSYAKPSYYSCSYLVVYTSVANLSIKV